MERGDERPSVEKDPLHRRVVDEEEVSVAAEVASSPHDPTFTMPRLRPPPVSLLDKYGGPDFQPIYATSVTVTGGEAGHARASGFARSDDGKLQVQLRLPTEMGGEGDGTNPEQLFAAAYAACFHGALKLLATRNRIDMQDASVEVSVAFGRDPVDGLFALHARVRIFLPGVEKSTAEELVRNTERLCPYAKMARNGITSVVALAAPDKGQGHDKQAARS